MVKVGVDVRGSVTHLPSVVGIKVLDEGGVQKVLMEPLPCRFFSDSSMSDPGPPWPDLPKKKKEYSMFITRHRQCD